MQKALNKKYMRLVVKEARKNLATMHGGPFGACVVKGGRVLAAARNKVLKNDATCHEEINAIRAASKKLGTHNLSGAVIYSTTEPCPMCFSAIHWAEVGIIVYGTSIKDAQKLGFSELSISSKKMKNAGRSGVEIVSGFMLTKCRDLLKDWEELEYKKVY